MLLNKVNSFTSNSKPLKLLKAAAFIAVFLVIEGFLGELLAPIGRYKIYPEVRWDEFYQYQSNIDVLILGSSHAYRGFDPRIFADTLELNAFNMGSSFQNPIDSYYTLQEVLRRHTPKVVIFEVYWKVFEGEDYNFESATYNYDNMAPSWNKVNYLFSGFTYEQYLKANLLSIRYHENWSKHDVVQFNFRHKYLGHPAETSVYPADDKYIGLGFVASTRTATDEELTTKNRFSNSKMDLNGKRVDYLMRIINLCKKHDIPLVLVSTPLPQESVALIQDYPSIHNYFADIAQDEGLYYLDYSVISPDHLTFEQSHFQDDHHLNLWGSELFSSHLAGLIDQLVEGQQMELDNFR